MLVIRRLWHEARLPGLLQRDLRLGGGSGEDIGDAHRVPSRRIVEGGREEESHPFLIQKEIPGIERKELSLRAEDMAADERLLGSGGAETKPYSLAAPGRQESSQRTTIQPPIR